MHSTHGDTSADVSTGIYIVRVGVTAHKVFVP